GGYGCYGVAAGAYPGMAFAAAPSHGHHTVIAATTADPAPSVRDDVRLVRRSVEPEAAAPARVTVRLPAEARLWVDGVACPLASETRTFATPQLQAGQQ